MRANLVAALALVATPAWAQRTLAIKSFDAAIRVEQDGTVDVTETITAQFTGSWNGIYRSIPVGYRTPQGFDWTLRLDLLGAGDAQGNALRVEAERDRHYRKFRIWVPGAQDATRTVVLHYRAANGLRFFEEHDELYWNVTGDEWDVPIEAVSAVIELPAAAAGVRAIAFNGAYGSTAQDASVAIEGTTVRLVMPHALGFHEGLTAVVGWNKGAVVEPTGTEVATEFASSNWPILIPVFVFLGMLLIWHRLGRDPESRPVAVQYEPPGTLTPAEAGTLMDGSADMRDITATLVDLAVRGHIRIEEREENQLFGLIKTRDYVFHRTTPNQQERGLLPHEQRVLDGIFGSSATRVRLSDLEDEFYTSLPGIRTAIYDGLKGRNLYRSRPDRVKSRWLAIAAVLVIVIVGLGSTVGSRWNLNPFPVFLAAGASGLIVVLFGQVMPARTVAGARTLERVGGFEEFLRRVEGDRYRNVVKTPEMFERFLPYAMLFGVERKWARAFEDIVREPPRWYAGPGPMHFNATSFSSRLSDLSSRAGTTMSSSPRSSGGSGFGGGGSSGGGSGGGGGGGF
jgi:uncharacterized protein (TIGR04222 family)